MSKIDTTKWGEFKVEDVLLVEQTKSVPSKSDIIDGDIPYVTRSVFNNGYYEKTCGNIDKINNGNCITIGAESGIAFYQRNNFVAGNKVYRLSRNGLTEKEYLYLVSILNTQTKNYSYSNARTPEKIKNEIIRLPIYNDGTPDWEYMESYMRIMDEKAKSKIEKLKKAQPVKHMIDTIEWGEFKIGDLFTIINGKAHKQCELTLSDDGIALACASNKNNGIAGHFIGNITKIFDKGQITWGKQCPYFCYQEENFTTGQGMYIIDTRSLNKYSALFLISILNATIPQKYDYKNCLIGSVMENEIIKLPVNIDGTPNWEYMENYMRKIEEKARARVSKLVQTYLT